MPKLQLAGICLFLAWRKYLIRESFAAYSRHNSSVESVEQSSQIINSKSLND
jgi:hypothetical protein